jgi:hypothetical protein
MSKDTSDGMTHSHIHTDLPPISPASAGPRGVRVRATAAEQLDALSAEVWTVALPESDPPSAGASTKPTGQQVAESVVIALAVRNATCGLQFEWSRRSGGHVR